MNVCACVCVWMALRGCRTESRNTSNLSTLRKLSCMTASQCSLPRQSTICGDCVGSGVSGGRPLGIDVGDDSRERDLRGSDADECERR